MLLSRKLGKLFCFTLLTLADCLHRIRFCGKATVQWMQNASCPDSWNACSCLPCANPRQHLARQYHWLYFFWMHRFFTVQLNMCPVITNWSLDRSKGQHQQQHPLDACQPKIGEIILFYATHSGWLLESNQILRQSHSAMNAKCKLPWQLKRMFLPVLRKSPPTSCTTMSLTLFFLNVYHTDTITHCTSAFHFPTKHVPSTIDHRREAKDSTNSSIL